MQSWTTEDVSRTRTLKTKPEHFICRLLDSADIVIEPTSLQN